MQGQEDFCPVGVYDLQGLQKKVTEQCNQMVPLVRAVFTSAEFMGITLRSAEIPSVNVTERPWSWESKRFLSPCGRCRPS